MPQRPPPAARRSPRAGGRRSGPGAPVRSPLRWSSRCCATCSTTRTCPVRRCRTAPGRRWRPSSGRASPAPSCCSSNGPRAGDPWSGHMALPGGRIDPGDPHPRAAAERETREEVSLDLTPATLLGQLNDLYGGARPITVSAFGYWLDGPRPALQPNGEVADTLWIPLEELADPARAVAYEYPLRDQTLFPGIAVSGERVVWGMTLRLLMDLFERLGRPLTFPV
ncbi:MAG: CoA pyrophosphatase [Acidimicrobiales bacterium]